MIVRMLVQLERNPAAAFYERELAEQFPVEFAEARRSRLLMRLPLAERYDYQLARPRLVVPLGQGRYEAYDEDDPEEDPIALTAADLAQWAVDRHALAQSLRATNNLRGTPELLDERLHFLGEASSTVGLVAYLLGLFTDDSSARRCLLGLPGRLPQGGYGQFVVACPTFDPPPGLRRELDSLGISIVPLEPNGRIRLTATPTSPAIPDPDEKRKSRVLVHSEDYTSVSIGDQDWALAPREAKAIEILHSAHLVGARYLPASKILTGVQMASYKAGRMGELLRNIPNADELVVSPRRGYYGLNL